MDNYEKLNSNISEVEKIISSKYNFMFLEINQGGASNADIMLSILQARVITEGMCRFIVLHEHMVVNETKIRTATFKVYIDDFLRPSLFVPKDIISYLLIVQEICNESVHFQKSGYVDLKRACMCLEALESIAEWFVKMYSGQSLEDMNWKIQSDALNKNWAIPPKEDGCILSRKCEVDEIKDLLSCNKLLFLRGDKGVGKTELVKDYAGVCRKKYRGFCYAENIDEINDYIFGLPIGIRNDEQKTKEEIVEEKLSAIHSVENRFMFIIDNYTGTLDDLQCMYPNDEDVYHLMIIVDDEYEIDEDVPWYEVKAFSPEDSLQIFRYFCEGRHKNEDVMELLSVLSFNPRAIKMSALFLRDNTAYDPKGLVDSIKKGSSLKSITQNLYTVLMEFSILESDEYTKQIAGCLSLLPYNGVSKNRFIELICGIDENKEDKNKEKATDEEMLKRQVAVEERIRKLESAGWLSIDKNGCISMNSLLSDTIFERIHPDMTSDVIFRFVDPILKPIRDIRELFLPQVIALEPFVEHLAKRVVKSGPCHLNILDQIREYYIAVYNVEKIDLLTELMEREFDRRNLYGVTSVEDAIYRQGISRFNLEDFSEAHKYFSRALDLLGQKEKKIKKAIARICSYEGSSLAAIGKAEEAVETVKRGIEIRNRLGADGDRDEENALWISHYNYAKVLMEIGRFEEAETEIDVATSIYKMFNSEAFEKYESTNISTLFQLKGRIYAGLGKYDEAIQLVEDAKTIRENLKGPTYFSTAQIYSYLMDIYSSCGNYEKASYYAGLYHDVLIHQQKTEDIKAKIEDTEEKIIFFKEKKHNG